uniref:Integrase catalytic domain-containing protein n=1 Tax=Biomphalaria glabrata TaxID=6526 RepID=A0A2C9LZ67_BIOGL
MSAEVQKHLNERGVAKSRTMPYNPRENGQIEKLNKSLWNAITLALHSQDLSISQWELVLQDALHSIRSLLCTATNKTPHERLFGFYRRSTFLPKWLTSPGPVLLKRNNRSSKYDPLTKEVELVNSNPQYALIRTPTSREETVSLRLLAPKEKDYFTENMRPLVLRDGSSWNATPSLQSETENNAENSTLNPPANQSTESILSGEEDLVEAPTIESPSNLVGTDSRDSTNPTCRYNLRERKSKPNYRV